MSNCNIRFMSNNLASGANISVSTEDNSSVPASNLVDDLRSRVWRPNGYFEITAANNLIYINDGSDKTATIAVGNYASPNNLAGAVETALNAVSSFWSVSYLSVSGQFKFRIQRSAVGTLRTTVGTSAAWDTLGYDSSVVNLTGQDFVAQHQRNHTSEWVLVDLAVNTKIDFFGMIGPIDKPVSISEAATVILEANNVNDWSAPPLQEVWNFTNFNTAGFFKFFADTDDSNYRYWRFRFIDRENPLGPEGINLGYMYLGNYETITSSNVQRGFGRALTDPSVEFTSERGVQYHDTRVKQERFSPLSITNLTAADKATIDQVWYYFGVSRPLFVSIDPELKISDDIAEYTRFVHFTREPRVNHIVFNYYSVGLEFEDAI